MVSRITYWILGNIYLIKKVYFIMSIQVDFVENLEIPDQLALLYKSSIISQKEKL